MKRLMHRLDIGADRCVLIVDTPGLGEGLGGKEWDVGSLRSKHDNSGLNCVTAPIRGLAAALAVAWQDKIQTVISTGPGMCIIPSLLFRLLGREVIHLETWSRFDSRSFTGRVMYRVATKFYVQNASLMSLYRNAIYAGRL
jgi:UDP-N-acetylglucosamine:LPS N-acetylglucosamine transferase